MKTLLELSFEAAQAVSRFKNPDIEEWKDRVFPILQELDIVTTCVDIEHIQIEEFGMTIEINDRYGEIFSCQVPMRVIEAEDPIKEAKIVWLEDCVEKHKTRVRSLSNMIKVAEAKLRICLGDLELLKSS